ncbi:hypothetical protein GJAV_G00004280, partial [Gymnothorax javanicus]
MMQARVCLRQDTETNLPEFPEQHRISEKEEELHGLESVHMAESETKCTTPGLNTLEPEGVTANSRELITFGQRNNAGRSLGQDTETTLPELPEQHRIREKEEELHGLESVHMAESETKCTTLRLNTLEPECVSANSRVSELHYRGASLVKTETDLGPTNTGVLKTESLDFTELAFVTHLHSDQIKTHDGETIKTEHVSILPDIKCVYIKSD